jgi:hypothetical protein
MANHLDLSRERLRALVAEGVLEQSPGGGFDLDKTRRAYIRFLRQRPARSAGQDALRNAKVKQVELRTQRDEKTLLKQCIDQVDKFNLEANQRLVGQLMSIPARFTRNLADRKRLEGMIDDVRRVEARWCRDEAARIEKEKI